MKNTKIAQSKNDPITDQANKTNTHAFIIIAIMIIGCILMALVDGFIKDYALKSIIKIVLFTGLPTIYFMKHKQPLIPNYLSRPKSKKWLVSLLLGLLVFSFILGAYFILGHLFDFSMVVVALETNVGVTPDNFVFVSVYISIVNSFLEEFFFRGFAFLTLKQYLSKPVTYIVSALIFTLYHIAIMSGWFNPLLFLLLLVGLFVAGLLFNYIDDKTNTILTSWFVHMFANIAINVIGFMLLGMI